MKALRHTVNVPSQMERLLNERIQDYRSLSGYFATLGFTDASSAFPVPHALLLCIAAEMLLAVEKHGSTGLLADG